MQKYMIMTFGLGGNGAEILDTDNHNSVSHSSWYLKPEELQKYICNDHYKPSEMEGCILVDLREVVEKSPSLALKAPLCNPRLKDDEIDRFDLKSVGPIGVEMMREFTAGGGGAAVASAFMGGLDEVSPKMLGRWWQSHGARMGTVKDGKVVWDA